MSSPYQGVQPGRGAESYAADAARFFGQLTLLPLTTAVYSMEVFVELLKGVQRAADQAVGGGATQSCGGGPCGESSFINNAGWQGAGAGAGGTRRMTQVEERNMSDQNWSSSGNRGLDTTTRDWGSGRRDLDTGRDWSTGGGGTDARRDDSYGQRDDSYNRRDDDWRMSEDCREKDPCDRLRLVRFKILFLKRDLEIAFPEEEELVAEDMTKDGFISWKVAEFIQKLTRSEVKQPGKWKDENNYPANEEGGVVRNGYVISLPDKDKRFLRVYCQVLAWYDREKRNFERDQADELREIRQVLEKCLCKLVENGNGENKDS
jgi:hypothetical protein